MNSVVFNTSGILYNHVCGRIIWYQFETAAAIAFYNGNPSNYSVEGNYYVPMHTYANTANNAVFPHPPWVGTNYFCESGTTTAQNVFYPHDPLWDGKLRV